MQLKVLPNHIFYRLLLMWVLRSELQLDKVKITRPMLYHQTWMLNNTPKTHECILVKLFSCYTMKYHDNHSENRK